MGSIQNKRASARQAPPQLYVQFVGGDGDNDEVLRNTRKWILWVGFIILIFVIMGLFAMFTVFPPKLHDDKPSWPGPFHDIKTGK